MRSSAILAIAILAGAALPAFAASLSIDLAASPSNPAIAETGDRLSFQTTIRNASGMPLGGVLAWITLAEVDPGHERPVDIEDWSVQKVVAFGSLAPGGTVDTQWPVRPPRAGRYRIMVSAASPADTPTESRVVDFAVRPGTRAGAARILPVAIGLPALVAATFLFGRRRRR